MEVDMISLMDGNDTFEGNVKRMHRTMREAVESGDYCESRLESMGDFHLLMTISMDFLAKLSVSAMRPDELPDGPRVLLAICEVANMVVCAAEGIGTVRRYGTDAPTPIGTGEPDPWGNGMTTLDGRTFFEAYSIIAGDIDRHLARRKYDHFSCLYAELSMRLSGSLDVFWKFDQCRCPRCSVPVMGRLVMLYTSCCWAAEGLGLCRPATAASAKSGREAAGDGAGAHQRRRGSGR